MSSYQNSLTIERKSDLFFQKITTDVTASWPFPEETLVHVCSYLDSGKFRNVMLVNKVAYNAVWHKAGLSYDDVILTHWNTPNVPIPKQLITNSDFIKRLVVKRPDLVLHLSKPESNIPIVKDAIASVVLLRGIHSSEILSQEVAIRALAKEVIPSTTTDPIRNPVYADFLEHLNAAKSLYILNNGDNTPIECALFDIPSVAYHQLQLVRESRRLFSSGAFNYRTNKEMFREFIKIDPRIYPKSGWSRPTDFDQDFANLSARIAVRFGQKILALDVETANPFSESSYEICDFVTKLKRENTPPSEEFMTPLEAIAEQVQDLEIFFAFKKKEQAHSLLLSKGDTSELIETFKQCQLE